MNNHKVSFFLLIFISFFYSLLHSFETIEDAKQYAESMEEYPTVEISDWTNPNYSLYHKKRQLGFIWQMLEKYGLYRPTFSPLVAKNKLQQITQKRVLEGFFGGRFIQKKKAQEGQHVLIFGDLCGAFHSFVRDLVHLKKLNIISDDFVLNKNYSMVINGNVADKSPYILETLSVIARLLEQNQEQVFYLRGDVEDKQGWIGRTLEYELKARGSYISSEKIPLQSVIDQFFDTLPLALFVTQEVVTQETDNTIHAIRFSAAGFSDKELDLAKIETFLASSSYQSHYKLYETKQTVTNSGKKVTIVALFRLEDRKKNYRVSKGLVSLDDEEGIKTFATISSPIEAHRRLYDFFSDAFVQLNIAKELQHSKLFLFYRDVREPHSFIKESVPFLDQTTTKKAIETKPAGQVEPEKPVAQPRSFTFGCTLDLSRVIGYLGRDHRTGMLAATNRYKKEHNLDIDIQFLDDQYKPDVARQNIEKLLQQNIDIILSPVGSPTTEKYLDLIKEKKILTLFPITGSPLFRSPELFNVVNFRASYDYEIYTLLEEAIQQLHAAKIVIFYQDDAFGQSALAGIERYEKKYGSLSNVIVKVPHERNNVNFEAQTAIIKNANPQIIILVTITSSVRELFRLFELSFFTGKVVLGVSGLSEKSFVDFAKEKGITIKTLSVVPNPLGDLEIAKRYQEDMREKREEINTFSFEGYINATIACDTLLSLQPNSTTLKEDIVALLQSRKNYNLFGLTLTFNEKQRDLGQGLWWVSDDKEWKAVKEKIGHEHQQKTANVATEIQKEEDKQPLIEKKPQQAKIKLNVGCSLDLSRALSHWGRQHRYGMLAVTSRYKKEHDLEVNIKFLDDEYTPEITQTNIEKFLQQGIDIILSPMGSPTTEKYLDLIKGKRVLVLFPITGSSLFRSPDLPYIINFRASYDQEGYILMQEAKRQNINKIVVFYQNDSFGRAALAGIERYAKKYTIPDNELIKVPYERNSVNFEIQKNSISATNPQAILLITVTSAARELFRLFDLSFFTGKIILGVSDLSEKSFIDFAKEKGINIKTLSVVPNPLGDLEIAKRYREDLREKNDEINTMSFEGYISATIACDTFLSLQPNSTTLKEDIVALLQSRKNYNLFGLTLSFDEKQHDLGQGLWWVSDDKEWKTAHEETT
jgi:branched-chain amino acid transport system substrate-binding protein